MAKDEAEQEANDALQKPSAAHTPMKAES
jgi:hypothetical protein